MIVGLNLVFLVPGEMGGMEIYRASCAARSRRATTCADRSSSTASGRSDWEELGEVVVPVDPRRRASSGCAASSCLRAGAAAAGVDAGPLPRLDRAVRGRFRRVTTIHDLNYRARPEAHFGLRGLGMRVLVPAAARARTG